MEKNSKVETTSVQLSKTSNETDLKSYFNALLILKNKNEEFPVDLDEVWMLVYGRKSDAVEALISNEQFVQDIDYQVLRQNPQNPKGGRPTTKYYLSLSCLEYFIVRKVRPVFEVYRQVFHKVAESYMVPKTFAEALQLAADQQRKVEEQQKLLEEQKPKVKLAEAITTNERCYPLKDLASILASKGINIGPNRLRHFLKDNHYLGDRGACYNMPRHQYIEQGLFIVTEEPYTDQFGHTHISRTVLLTGKGLEYFINKLYKETNKR